MSDESMQEAREALWANTYEGFVAALSDPGLVALAMGGKVVYIAPSPRERPQPVIVLPPREGSE